MKIFILAPGYPDEDNLSANIFIKQQAEALNEIGNQVVVLHCKIYPTSKFLAPVRHGYEVFQDGEIIRYRRELKSFLYKVFPMIHSIQCNKCFTKLYNNAVLDYGVPNVLYAHFSCYAGYAATRISLKENLPVVTIEHSGYFLKKKVGHWQKHCLKSVVVKSKAFLCVSEGQRKRIESLTGQHENINVLPNIIDRCFNYHPLVKKNGYIFLTVGNLYRGKRIKQLVEVFCNEFKRESNVMLYICGDGEERGVIEKLIRSYEMHNRVILFGRLRKEGILEKYIECDCFVLPSKHETFGIVYREALCVGRPIITTDHSGFSDSEWNEAFGLRIPIDDFKELGKAMRAMYNTADKYDAKTISDSSRRLYSEEAVKENLIKYLFDVSKCINRNGAV